MSRLTTLLGILIIALLALVSTWGMVVKELGPYVEQGRQSIERWITP